eukprot:1258137-Prymnesium_polylepis.1
MPRRVRSAVVVEDEPIEQRPGSGQDPASFAKDLAAQPELLAAAADLLKRRRADEGSIESELEAPATSSKKKSKKQRKA